LWAGGLDVHHNGEATMNKTMARKLLFVMISLPPTLYTFSRFPGAIFVMNGNHPFVQLLLIVSEGILPFPLALVSLRWPRCGRILFPVCGGCAAVSVYVLGQIVKLAVGIFVTSVVLSLSTFLVPESQPKNA
jgi:hypothetical protein